MGADADTQWLRSNLHFVRAVVAEKYPHNGTILVNWQPQGVHDDNEKLPPVVPDGVPCDQEGGAYIEKLAEPQACQAEFIVHVAALCAHPRLVPRQPQETRVISCLADNATRDAIRPVGNPSKAEQ